MKRILALLPLTAFVGCASLSSYQEARVTEKGKAELFFGATGYQDDLEKVDVSFTSANSGTIDTTDGLSSFMFEVGGRVGVWDNLDLGIKYSFPGSVALDAKYQLLGRDSGSAFQLSAGLKGGYASLEGKDDEGEDVDGVPVIDLIVPVYATYSPTTWMAVTVAPQFCYRISDNGYYYPEGPIAGANIGLRLGKTVGLRGEFGYHRNLDADYSMMNYGAVLYAPFDPSSLLSGLF